MILETERLLLRPWEATDAEDLYEYAKDSRVGPPAGWLPHTSAENSREIIRTVLSEPETYAVCRKEDGKPVGSVGLKIGGRNNDGLPETEGEIGYWIGVPFWGQGLIPEAVRELIRRAFKDLRLETLWCGYFDGNEKSKRVQEKCGFTYHHTNQDVYWKLTDDIRTEHFTRLTREDWIGGFTVRPLTEDELPAALALAWKVFSEYESPDYSEEGTEEFRKTLRDERYLAGIAYCGAFDGNRLIGLIGFRPDRRHICFFFVDGGYHRLGVGTRMFRCLLQTYPGRTITLNSSPYGLPFYRKLGFTPTGCEQTVNGIRFTPMEFHEKYDITDTINNMIRWAESRLGNTEYAGWCLSFIEDALEIGNGIEVFGGDSAKGSAELYADVMRTDEPERGAFVFYDCVCIGEDGPVNWGHCGIALGDGNVIHAWDKVRIDGYRDVEQMTALSGDRPKYIGWVPVERVLAQRPDDRQA